MDINNGDSSKMKGGVSAHRLDVVDHPVHNMRMAHDRGHVKSAQTQQGRIQQ